MRDMTEEEKAAVYDRGECPFCGEDGYYAGPRGGAMMNVSFKCGGKINIIDPESWDSMGFMRLGQVLEEPEGYSPNTKSSEGYGPDTKSSEGRDVETAYAWTALFLALVGLATAVYFRLGSPGG